MVSVVVSINAAYAVRPADAMPGELSCAVSPGQGHQICIRSSGGRYIGSPA
jgi:hypothetical protein